MKELEQKTVYKINKKMFKTGKKIKFLKKFLMIIYSMLIIYRVILMINKLLFWKIYNIDDKRFKSWYIRWIKRWCNNQCLEYQIDDVIKFYNDLQILLLRYYPVSFL